MIRRQYVSDTIDVLICLIPSSYLAYVSEIGNTFSFLNLFSITAIVYMMTCLLAILSNNGRSVGNVLQKIVLISLRHGKPSTKHSIYRMVSIFIILLSMSQFHVGTLAIIVALVAPIPFQMHGHKIVSMLYLISKTTFVAFAKT